MSTATTNVRAAMERAAAIRPKVGGFPYLAETLRQAGVTRCRMAVPSNAMLYLTDAGPVVDQGEPLVTGMVDVMAFDREALVKALRADQAGETTFHEFVQGCWKAGVVWYDVDLVARTCTYYGADGDSYTEIYVAVDV
ncbi:DUF1398 family protein [Streptomyces silvisoli]|uniref:DUF1398 family protein n=1 Tax=Streptomyces silvisoli TaxID=3034235 RepID=A0ABT5ZL26_9ACTN|nr:DUF1398 family protein [Streptomyces silvisoli]MDF3289688.1 DUF1398 family protein [Streptomyces silvisoli]